MNQTVKDDSGRIIRQNRHRTAFNDTIDTFNIVVASLCKRANVSESAISRFRSGETDFLAGTMQDVIDAMEPIAQAFYYGLLMTTRPDEPEETNFQNQKLKKTKTAPKSKSRR